MKAYKGFNKDMTCLGFQYEEGKTFETKVALLGETGFHAAVDPLECFSHYHPASSVYHKVDVDNIDVEGHERSHFGLCGTRITIGNRIDWKDLVQTEIESIKNDETSIKTTGRYTCAYACNKYDKVLAEGEFARAVSSADSTHAISVGECSKAIMAGEFGCAVAMGDYAQAHAIAEGSDAIAHGIYSNAVATNTYGKTFADGDYGIAVTTSWLNRAAAKGKETIAAALGDGSIVLGSLGTWLICVERDEDSNILNIAVGQVDGKRLKPDTWYIAENGTFVEYTKD